MIAAVRGDPAARRKLVEAFMPQIGALARQFLTGRVEREDLMQEGVAGLLFAARRYDTRLGTPFWAYASFWVRKSMQELVADLARPVALSDRAVRELAQVKKARAQYMQSHSTDPTVAQLSTATGFTQAQIDNLLATELTPRGMEEPVSADGDAMFGDGISDRPPSGPTTTSSTTWSSARLPGLPSSWGNVSATSCGRTTGSVSRRRRSGTSASRWGSPPNALGRSRRMR